MSDPMIVPMSVTESVDADTATFTIGTPQSTVVVSFARSIDSQGRKELVNLLDQLLPLMEAIWRGTDGDGWTSSTCAAHDTRRRPDVGRHPPPALVRLHLRMAHRPQPLHRRHPPG